MLDLDTPVLGRVPFYDLSPKQESFQDALIAGLSRRPRSIPSRFLYDAQGSALFDRICDLPEYYPTRTEMRILEDCAADIAGLIGPEAALIELGSGSSVKVRLLLDAMERPSAYLPIDVSGDHLRASAEALAADYPQLAVAAICADYGDTFPLPETPGRGREVAFFPGSTIGNFEPEDAEPFLAGWARSGVDMIVGVDLVKAAEILEPAYDDAQGVTEAFSLNLLARANREVGADFDTRAFAHRSRWNADRSRIEIAIVSLKGQTVHVAGRAFAFDGGERIETEHSYKYTVDGFQGMAARAGYDPAGVWLDADRLFSVHYLKADPA
jgi:dimethylhistidine N-methyltransferase